MSEPQPVRPTASNPQLEAATETVNRGGETAADTSDEPTPKCIGEYVVISKLGEGGMGAVYLAEDPRLGRHVAIKTLKRALAASKTDRDRFVREARAAAQVTHDNVIPILHVGEDAGLPYMVMPFLPGEPLDVRLKREPVASLDVLLKVAHEVSAGLAAAHARGLIHRDIKPGNIWLERDPAATDPALGFSRCKILDFGLARSVDGTDAQITATGAIIGTPAFMAPEQAKGEKVDHRADLFSLGAMLYRMATGEAPFKGPNVMAVLIALTHDTPRSSHDLNPTLPPDVVRLIDRLMCKDPAGRPQSAAEVAVAVRSFGSLPQMPGSVPGAVWSAPAARPSVGALPPGLEATTASLPQLPFPTSSGALSAETLPVPALEPRVGAARALLTELVTGFALVPLVAVACAAPWLALPGARWALPARVFALTTALAWAMLLVGRLPVPRDRIALGHRMLQLLVGLGIGALAFWCGGWVLPALDDATAGEVVVVGAQRVGRDALFSGVKYLLYFGLVVTLVRWWTATDPARRPRMQIRPFGEVAVLGAVLLLVWPADSAPLLLGLGVLVGAMLAVQLVAPRTRAEPSGADAV